MYIKIYIYTQVGGGGGGGGVGGGCSMPNLHIFHNYFLDSVRFILLPDFDLHI